jgi:PAS domain S-box-containing protein
MLRRIGGGVFQKRYQKHFVITVERQDREKKSLRRVNPSTRLIQIELKCEASKDHRTMSLCGTTKLLGAALNGSSESALVVDVSGLIVFANGSAKKLLATSENKNIERLLEFSQPWQDVVKSEKEMHTAVLSSKGIPVTTKLTKLGGCPCCDAELVCVYIIADEFNLVRDMFDASFQPMFTIGGTGKIVAVNSAATDLFGYTHDEFIGKNISMICGGGHSQHHDRYIRNYLETGIEKIIGTQREVPAKRKDGSEFPVELGIKEIFSNGQRFFCGFIKDLSSVKGHELEMKETQSLSQGMIDASFDPMIEIDEQGIIRVVNQAAVSMLGYSKKEFIGSNIRMICGQDHGAHHDEYLARYLSTGQKRIIGRKRHVMAKRKNGMEFEIELGIQEVRLSSGKRAFCGYMRDLTQQNLDKKALKNNAAMIHGQFFYCGHEEDK